MTTATAPEDVREAMYARVVHIEPEKIHDNPWQPRASIDTEGLRELAESIHEQGLLQPPVGRFKEEFSDQVQLAFGHRRVRAIELLITEKRWSGGIPVSVQVLTDADMVLMALAENTKRQDLTALEEYRAYAKALEEVKGLTITALAASIGIDRSTLSNNLRILKLPKVVLERVESGGMTASAAREFLVLMNDDHVHEEEMGIAVKWIAATSGTKGAPDWRREHVRKTIIDATLSRDRLWRPLGKKLKASEAANRHHAIRPPNFDVKQFKKDHPDQVHNLPTSTGGTLFWTCNVKEWRRLQTAATREENKTKKGKGQPVNKMEELLLEALATDPVLMDLWGVSLETVDENRHKPIKALTPEEVEKLGTRAKPKGVNDYGEFPVSLDGSGYQAIPAYFPDIDECLTKCTWGATYGRRWDGDLLHLWCMNQEHYKEKLVRGKKEFKTRLEAQREQDDAQDSELVRLLEDKLSVDSGLAWMVASSLLAAQEQFNHLTPNGTRGFEYHPKTIQDVAQMLEIPLKTGDQSWDEHSAMNAKDAVHALGSVSADEVSQVAAKLVAWVMRAVEVESISDNPLLSVSDALVMMGVDGGGAKS